VVILCGVYQKDKKFELGDKLISELDDVATAEIRTIAAMFYMAASEDASDDKFLWLFESDKDSYVAKGKEQLIKACSSFSGEFVDSSKIAPVVKMLVRTGLETEAENAILQNLSHRPGDLKTHLLLADYYGSVKEYAKEFRVWEKVSRLSLKAESKFYFSLIRAAVKKQDYQYALHSLKRHLKTNVKDQFAWYQLGMVEYETKDFEAAVISLKKAPKINHAGYMIAICLRELNKYTEALAAFKR